MKKKENSKDQSTINLEEGMEVNGWSYMSEGKRHWKAQSDSMCPFFESLREAA